MTPYTIIGLYPDNTLLVDTIDTAEDEVEAFKLAFQRWRNVIEEAGLTLVAAIRGEHVVYDANDYDAGQLEAQVEPIMNTRGEGFLRCCRDTLRLRTEQEPVEGTQTSCRWCGADLVFRRGAWEWIDPNATPIGKDVS